MIKTLRIAGLCACVLAIASPVAAGPGSPTAPVKKAVATNLCYMPANLDYSKVLKYTPFKTLKDCLKSGGHLALSKTK